MFKRWFGTSKRPQENTLEEVARRLGGLGRSAASIAGSAEDLEKLNEGTSNQFQEIHRVLGSMIETDRLMAEVAQEGARQAHTAHDNVRGALDKAMFLATTVERVQRGAQDISDTLNQVASVSDEIGQIAFQTRLVAFNASVEAARAGEAGRGFGVVAQSVKDLSDQVEQSSRSIHLTIRELTLRLDAMKEELRNADASGAGHSSVEVVQGAIESFESNFSSVEATVRKMADGAAVNQGVCHEATRSLRQFDAELRHSESSILGIRQDTEHLLGMSEEAIEFLSECGVETTDTPFIVAVISRANKIGLVFEEAVAQGRISLGDLFNENYQPIPGTDPKQFLSRFVDLTDAILPPIQEPVLQLSPLIAFCAAVDRNGYLPTHNMKYSKAQGPDPVKNAAICRNRRIFNDRTGLRAARNKKRFLLQTYRRDMGGGHSVLMKDVSAPIFVQGRHWGGLRIGFGFN